MESYAQANQDIFVLECLNNKRSGYFLDLGCSDPIIISNTYLLEKEYGWKGIAIDIEQTHIDKFRSCRNSIAICDDCTTIDINQLLDQYQINHVDYLSLDLEPASATLSCLKNLPLNKKTFGVITFEHDFYRFGDKIREESRNILQKHGYHALCKNISAGGCIYEDWYVNPTYVNIESISYLTCDTIDHSELVKNYFRKVSKE